MEQLKKNASVLFYDTDNRGNKEALMDYCLGYTFKMCDLRYHKEKLNPELQKVCLKILARLLEVEDLSTDIRIQTYFQYKDIDLIVEVYYKNETYTAILIEDKVDHKLDKNQLPKYKKIFDEHYNSEIKCIDKKYRVIKAADYGTDGMANICQHNGFKIMTLDELISGLRYETGNDIFDEFWLRDWE